ncbi:MAG: WD40 repeat domain-containing protein [Cytophagaceae bacterium]|nr:MAG: WD40 repeat domain-containing protein [Cytophagaceae bacterium]
MSVAQILREADSSIVSAALSPDGRFVVVLERHLPFAQVWDLQGIGTPYTEIPLPVSSPSTISFSPNGEHLVVTAETSSTVLVLDIPSVGLMS